MKKFRSKKKTRFPIVVKNSLKKHEFQNYAKEGYPQKWSHLNFEEFPVHSEGQSHSDGDDPDGDDDGPRPALSDSLRDITQQRIETLF
jgi:hypothetical protein